MILRVHFKSHCIVHENVQQAKKIELGYSMIRKVPMHMVVSNFKHHLSSLGFCWQVRIAKGITKMTLDDEVIWEK